MIIVCFSQNTWEPENNILDTALIHNFEQENATAKRLKRQRKLMERVSSVRSSQTARVTEYKT